MKANMFKLQLIGLVLSHLLAYTIGQEEGEIRLVGGLSPNEGRVEIYHYGEWGTVCDDGFSTYDANVICEQLGYNNGGRALSYAYFGPGTGQIWLGSLACTGSENTLSSCGHSGWGVEYCSHIEDASVICAPDDGDIRLVGGLNPYEGRVEIYHNGEWGTVCDDFFDTNGANVVCTQLGYSGPGIVVESAHFGYGLGVIWLDNVQCIGTENNIDSCSHNDWGDNNCGHNEDVGVICIITEAVVGCDHSTCQNGGTCIPSVSGHTCVCSHNWTGARCETDVDECVSSPCLNEGICTNIQGNYGCDCKPGWSGPTCGVIIDACISEPCQNNGNCINGINAYTCICRPGWSGARCNIAIDECASSPCLNGGTCIDLEASYSCICGSGWTGPTCGNDIDECASHVCQNTATCLNEINAYTCVCPAGFTGISCNISIDACSSGPCLNGGQCYSFHQEYTCGCMSGWTGLTCGNDIDECASDPCQHGGTCINGIAEYVCICRTGWNGTMCEIGQLPLLTDEEKQMGSTVAVTTGPLIGVIFAALVLGMLAAIGICVVFHKCRSNPTQPPVKRESQNDGSVVQSENPYVVINPEDIQMHAYEGLTIGVREGRVPSDRIDNVAYENVNFQQ